MRKLRFAGLLTGCAASLLAAAPAHAAGGKATRSMAVSATLMNGCTVSATPLVWFVPVPTSLNLDSTSTVTIRCTPNLDYTVEMDDGLYAQGSFNRRVKHSTLNSYIRYDIYKDPPRSKVWGKGAANNYPGNSGPTGINILTVYGRLNATKGFPAGGYQDTVTVTLNF